MRPRKAVITAAGFGTRLYPATKAVKKELFPVVGKDGLCRPAIQYNVEELVGAGIEEICLVVQPGDEKDFREYFSAPGPALEAKLKPAHLKHSQHLAALGERLRFAYQERQEGFGHAVYCARDVIGGEPFVLLLGDHVFHTNEGATCTEQAVRMFDKYGASVTAVCRVSSDLLPHVGVMAGDRLPDDPAVFAVREVSEKPRLDYAQRHLRVEGLADDEYYCHFGVYAFTPGIYGELERLVRDDIRECGEYQLSAAQRLLIGKEPYFGYEMRGERYDIGLPLEFARTVRLMARPV